MAISTAVSITVDADATIRIGVSAPAPPVAEFIGSPLSGSVPFTTTFTSQATGTISGHAWTFGDGATSTSANPTHAYTEAGTYTVTYTVTGPGGSDTRTRTAYVSASDGDPGLTVGAQIATLAVTSVSGSGSRPFTATVMPLRGQVPSSSTLTTADGSARATILSTHDDGSAALAVLTGAASATGSLAVHVATGSVDTALTTARIAALVSAVLVDVPGIGQASLTSFGSPAATWWASSQAISAMYRVPVAAHATLEAVVYIQAFASDRAQVEVVLENSKMTTATPTAPSAASYTGATVSVNGGAAVVTVNASAAPEGNHAAFRGWYASAWVGGDPGLRVAQAVAELQAHPLLWEMDQANTADMSTYASDAYTPWGTGRQRASDMGGGGDHDSIGPLPKWEAHALQTGDYRAWRAVEASALACLGYNINYRDSSTGLVPTFTQLAGKNQQTNWPVTYGPGDDEMGWEVAHHPAAGLMAFIARPSPVFIELAQKVAVWNGTWSSADGVGVHGRYYQLRGRAWCLRSLAHATFLTPDALAWKTPAKTAIAANVTYMDGWRVDAKALLNEMWIETTSSLVDPYSIGGTGHGTAAWQYHYLITELHKAASARLLTGASQTAINTLADWCALQPVRWVNEQTDGAWRYIPYVTVLGRNATTMDSLSTWGAQRAYWMTDSASGTTGPWKTTGSESIKTYAAFSTDSSAGALYPSYFWAALAAAVERGVTGAQTAWNTVQAGITSINTWRAGFATDPRWGSTPRSGLVFGAGATTGSYASNVWTPGRDGGIVNQVSWDLVPTGQWSEVANTRLDGLDAEVRGAVPSWSAEQLNWPGVVASFSALVPDVLGSRCWIHGGGANFGSNNGIYRFDAATMAWAVEKMPSDRSGWSAAGYTTGWSNYPPSQTSYNTKLGNATLVAINDVAPDELQDVTPTARHVYSGMIYDAVADQLVMMTRRLWKFDRASGAWNYRRQINDVLTYDYMDQEHVVLAYDEAARELICTASGSTTRNTTIGYNLATNTWIGVATWDYYYIGNPADCRHGRDVTVMSPPEYPSGYGSAGTYSRFNLDSRTETASGTVQFGGGLAQTDFKTQAPAYWDGGCLVYVPPINRYWLFTAKADNTVAPFEVDPTTTPWTMTTKSFTGSVPVFALNEFPGRKAVWLPGLNAVVLLARATANMYIYKF